jgi:hypothetical protein
MNRDRSQATITSIPSSQKTVSPLSLKAIEMLRTALTQVEGQAGLTSDDPALLEFKRSVVLNVAALEIAETEATASSNTADASNASDSPSDNAA